VNPAPSGDASRTTPSFLAIKCLGLEGFSLPNIVRALAPAVATYVEDAIFTLDSVKRPTLTHDIWHY
jgi:hypothetical protein